MGKAGKDCNSRGGWNRQLWRWERGDWGYDSWEKGKDGLGLGQGDHIS